MITTQPQSQTALIGGSVTFTVTASGSPPLAYQWQHNGADISGATSSSLALSSLQSGDAGNYAVIVQNNAAAVSSAAAILQIANPVAPIILSQPISRTAIVGSDVTFKVGTLSAPPTTYQWRRNGANISGATGSSLVVHGVLPAASGNYSVVIQNSYGSINSSDASLTVTVVPLPPVIIIPATSATLPATITLSVPGYPNATIYYTLNGSLPTTASTVYSTPLAVSSRTTITAFATRPNFLDSGLTASTIGDSDSPIAQMDIAPVAQDSAATLIDVLNNDTDPNDDQLILSSVTQPVNGTVVIAVGTSDLTYEPDPGFYGIDTFTYEATDPDGNAAKATVLVFVNKTGNNAPVVQSKKVTVPVGGNSVMIGVRDDAIDPDENNWICAYATTQPAIGQANIEAGAGAVTYLRNNGAFGADVVHYFATDGRGGLSQCVASIESMDADADRLPDDWEMVMGLNPLIDDSADDPDADGLSNRGEFILHTNPQLADNPLNLTGASFPNPIKGIVTIPLQIDPRIDKSASLQLLVDDEEADALVQRDDSQWSIEWDTLTIENGQHEIKLRLVYGLGSDQIRLFGASQFVNVNNAVTFKEATRDFTDKFIIDATVNDNSIDAYTVDIYDLNTSTYLTTLSGAVSDGRIQSTWDLLDQGTRVANGPLRCEFQFLSNGVTLPEIISTIWNFYDHITGDSRFTVAYGFNDYKGSKQDERLGHTILSSVINNLETLVDYNGDDTDYSVRPFGASIPYAAAFKLDLLGNPPAKMILKQALRESANFYWWGHGAPDNITSGGVLDPIEAKDIAKYLRNDVRIRKQAKTPYRLVILDGCDAYSSAWANAFGISYTKRGSLETCVNYTHDGREPAAFVAWPCSIPAPKTDNVKGMEELRICLNRLFVSWQTGSKLIDIMKNYSQDLQQGDASFTSDYDNNGKIDIDEYRISGCFDLRRF